MPKVFRAPGGSVQTPKQPNKPILGVSTSRAVVIGSFPAGPSYSPQQVKTLRDFERRFGGLRAGNLSSLVVSQFFANGGSDIWVISTGATFLRKASPLLKGLSLVPRIPFANLLLIPETFELSDRDVDQVYRQSVFVAVKQSLVYILDLPRRSSSFRTIHDLTSWVQSRQELYQPNVVVYFPFIQVHAVRKNSPTITMPSSGTLAGIYARVDQAQGVWKAPAGAEANLREVVGLEPVLGRNDQQSLTVANINPLTRKASAGYMAWGARTLSSDSEWKYVPVQRTAIYLRQSIQLGLKWAVFEPNDEPLWAQIRLFVGTFLETMFRQGAFQGRKARDAYFVRCGRDTITLPDQTAGRVNLVVGFAPLKPAEFIVIHIQQQAQSL
ncbi:MAG: phage tail sheath subtilisin-like domain-containing protein [Nitrospirales bacterium]|nr:phage tail sheath subtilisin-like domain-containing protein [Nitrospira sp.]MDR4500106.1 phage tail sheath subtilisin-like domain-containing protein [Nitrospirales bacterium]